MANRRKSEERRKGRFKQQLATMARGFESTTVKLPAGVKPYDWKKGTHKFNVLLSLAGKSNPHAEEGSEVFVRDYAAHRRIGPSGKSYVCPAVSCGKPCPVCEYVNRKRNDIDEELKQDLSLQYRQLYLVNPPDDEDNPLQVLDVPRHNFGKLLGERTENPDEDDDYFQDFMENDGGSTLKVTVVEDSFNGNKFAKASAIDFRQRKEPLPDEVLEHEVCLDDCLNVLSYDKLKAVFLQVEDDEDDPDDETSDDAPAKSSKAKSRKAKPEPEPEDDEDEEPEEKPKSRKTRKTKPEPEPDEDDDWDDDEEPEDEPAPKTKRKSKTKPEPEPEDDDSEPTEGQILRMDRDALVGVIERFDLDIDPDKFKRATALAAVVAEEMNARNADEDEDEEPEDDDEDWDDEPEEEPAPKRKTRKK